MSSPVEKDTAAAEPSTSDATEAHTEPAPTDGDVPKAEASAAAAAAAAAPDAQAEPDTDTTAPDADGKEVAIDTEMRPETVAGDADATAPAAPAAAAPAAAPAADSSAPPEAFLPLRLHALRTTYIAKNNHFLHCDPLVVIAVENQPMFKTSLRTNSTSCKWDLSNPADVQPVPGGIVLPTAAPSIPTLRVPMSSLPYARLQLHQEDFSRRKEDDDLGCVSLSLAELVTRTWKKEVKKPQSDGSVTARASGPLTARAIPKGSFTARVSSSSSAYANSASVAPTALQLQLPPSEPLPPPPAEDGWYPVSVEGAVLSDRLHGRHVGDVSISLSVQLEPYLRYLVAAKQHLRLFSDLTHQFLFAPSMDTPLRHVLLHRPSLKALLEFVVAAGADRGSMEGERMRTKICALLDKAMEVFKPEKQILDAMFENDSELWRILFQLRRCVPLSSLSSAAAFNTYEAILHSYFGLVERVALLLEPPPPPPEKTEEELAAEAAAAALAAKKAALRENKRRAAGRDFDSKSTDSVAASARSSSSSKKKRRGSMSAVLPDPPAHPPSQLDFGFDTLRLLRELFEAFRVRLTGFKKSGDVDWMSEVKVAELVACCQLLYKVLGWMQRWGSWSAMQPEANAETEAATESSAAAGASSSSSPSFAPRPRLSVPELRSLFVKDSGDLHGIWFQKQLSATTKKGAAVKETLIDNRTMAIQLQQHADFFLRNFPAPEKEKRKSRK